MRYAYDPLTLTTLPSDIVAPGFNKIEGKNNGSMEMSLSYIVQGIGAIFQIDLSQQSLLNNLYLSQSVEGTNTLNNNIFFLLNKQYIGCFFNCSAQISVLKRKTLFNQRGSFVHREFHGTESPIGCQSLFILVLKIGGNS